MQYGYRENTANEWYAGALILNGTQCHLYFARRDSSEIQPSDSPDSMPFLNSFSRYEIDLSLRMMRMSCPLIGVLTIRFDVMHLCYVRVVMIDQIE